MAPSLKPDAREAGATVCPPAALLASGLLAAGWAAGAFDAAADRAGESLGPDFLNGFDGALWDAWAEAVPGSLLATLPDLLAVALGDFADGVLADDVLAGVLADFPDLARAAFPGGVLGDFLRVFLDIRLPFVAFGGSIIGILRFLSGEAGFGPAAGQVR